MTTRYFKRYISLWSEDPPRINGEQAEIMLTEAMCRVMATD